MVNREQITNNVPTKLSAAVTTTGQTTFQVASGLNFPKVGNFRIMIGSEICIVTNVTQNSFVPATWTVTRAAEGTTASTYAIDTPINFVITQSSLRNWFSMDTRQTGTIATHPLYPPEKGDFFVPSDSFYTMVAFDGVSWKFLINGKAMTPPNFSDNVWTLESPDTNFTYASTYKAPILYSSAPAYSIHSFYRPIPATPYNMTIACVPHLTVTNYMTTGLCWRSSTGQYCLFGHGINNGSSQWWRYYNWNSYTSYSGDISNGNPPPSWYHGSVVWMRIRDDGTNRLAQFSGNGINWTTLGSTGRTTFLTPTYFGVHLSDNGVAANMGNTILHLEIS